MRLEFAKEGGPGCPIHIVCAKGFEAWQDAAPARHRAWAEGAGFRPKLGRVLLLPGEDGSPEAVLAGWGSAAERARGRLHLGALPRQLPKGIYHIASGLEGADLEEAALAWLLGSYRFEKYISPAPDLPRLAAPKGVDAWRLEVIAAGVAMTRDLINTPTADLGPAALENVFCDLASGFGAKPSVIRGEWLLSENFPMIHTVGRAAEEEPRLLDMVWGDPNAPKVTLVGKGVCFDTGGLNLKPGGSMGLMKKDMGGAGTVLGLARMIMALGLPVRLRVLVPAVENAVAGNAFRPGDILTSRKGLSVEVNNTDAEGRLVLADALALADEEEPDLLISMATLTGAARVALGPDLVPFFTDDEPLAGALGSAGQAAADPLWRMPFWAPYEGMIEPGIADLDNAPSGGFGGAITAALFLRRFVTQARAFAHFDCYGWTRSDAPGRPKGGESQGARALLHVLEARYGKRR